MSDSISLLRLALSSYSKDLNIKWRQRGLVVRALDL